MGKIIYVSGGARSGKSGYAEDYIAERYSKKIYLATGIAFDDEMKDKIEKHKRRRGKNWKTIENYKNIPNLLKEHMEGYDVVLLDCLTNMITNYMILDNEKDWEKISMEEINGIKKFITREIERIIQFIRENPIDMVVVTNELGMGLVPDNYLGRYFREIAGKINQIVAKESDEAYFVVSGIPMKLK
ncbi:MULTISPECIES: bifunctional adenosylcobinamide kinase/adenosylcobinamide-phosphate guanylyltransferase [Fusobacterium]|uniref:bifunctional adenosylcobinamide kinase/adenosylcobinamide-phosphate guanylyltransferase n=1 Tax=Fusobacterium TaxID=848 RepID=UPI0014769FF7|nr:MULTISPECIES: bifunctional adenosylcobinamide kinase/adenosylcobinamide-phosphate guanylyltransferase [Fusobacterium]NME36547.1 bifunctional adenosylcobinamide kinase/adenosylcobinamide-phosphate guanylyltransferase [Fusobacterium sp. FSA-380-WT-3A]